jgi:hypothetical protein
MGTPFGMGEKRPTNFELRLDRLAAEEPERDEERGILELFDDPPHASDEDAPLKRERPE